MPATPKKANILLWVAKAALALLFIFAGTMKFIIPPAIMQQGAVHLPIAFFRFIGTCEILGALGLVLPGIFRIHRHLTPLAAAGLVIIMIGATVVSLLDGMIVGAIVPAVVGSIALTVSINA